MNLISEMDKAKDYFYKGVVIENTFTNISEMAQTLLPFLKMMPWLSRLMLKMDWNSLDCVKSMSTPVMFISGDEDNFVPTQMTVKLHEACTSELKKILIVPGGNHNNTFSVAGEHYFKWLAGFSADCKTFKRKDSKKD